MDKFKKGEKCYWLTSFPTGDIHVVEILGPSPYGKNKYYITDPKGGSDTTHTDFLFKINEKT